MNYLKISFYAAVLLSVLLFCSCKDCTGEKIILPPGISEIPIDTIPAWEPSEPASVTFYVEASGSMAGFFRANKATHFKTDVASITSLFDTYQKCKIKVFKDANEKMSEFSFKEFRQEMNTGHMVTAVETIVPNMLEKVLEDIHPENSECAVLISDMIYDPVLNKALPVLLAEYESTIRNIAMKHNQPISVVCAVSNFLDRQGKESVTRSPYYYLIIGNKENVAYMRNCIATILKDEPENRGEKSRYVAALEFGLSYGNPEYSYNKTFGVYQQNKDLLFLGYNKSVDSCRIEAHFDLSKYPWTIMNDSILKSLIEVKTGYGSDVTISDIILSDNLQHQNSLDRLAEASLNFSLSNMPLKADIIEWRMKNIQNYYNEEFTEILKGQNANDRHRTFTMKEFLNGLGHAYSDEDNDYKQIIISTTK